MYLLDANVLIEAKNRYYAFDIAPGFWTWLDRAHNGSVACSIEAVSNEILDRDDKLAEWAQTNPDFFREIDQETTRHFTRISEWADSQNFTQAALVEFNGNKADYLLVAYAHEHRHTVVTLEQSAPKARKIVKIPDACRAMNVSITDTFHMLRQTGARLDLRADPPPGGTNTVS